MMPVATYPVANRLIAHIALTGDITPADLETLGQVGWQRAQAGRVYTVVDAAEITTLPRNLVNSALRSNTLLGFVNHPNARFFVFVAASSALRMMIDQVFRNVPYKMVDDLAAALDLLETQIIPNDTP